VVALGDAAESVSAVQFDGFRFLPLVPGIVSGIDSAACSSSANAMHNHGVAGIVAEDECLGLLFLWLDEGALLLGKTVFWVLTPYKE
jgi:hypothetical protein